MSVKNGSKGRPTKYTKEIGDFICSEIALGKSLSKITSENNFGMTSVFMWLRTDEDFLKNYTRAKEEQAETFADSIVDLADAPIERDQVFGRIDSAAVNLRRLQIDSRKWVASKLKPKKYGDSTTFRGDSEAPLNPSVNLILNK